MSKPENVLIALEKTRLRKEPVLFQMEKSAARDNLIYNLDKDYINDLKRERRLSSFNLADYLPTSLKKYN